MNLTLLAAGVLSLALPGLTGPVGLRLALERWADESAADRFAVRSALEKVVRALIAVPVVAPAFTAADTIRARLVALAAGPSTVAARWRLAVAAPALGLTLLAAASPPVHHALLNALHRCFL